MDDYQQRLAAAITRWPHDYIRYFMINIAPDIQKYGAWTVRSWNFPTTERSIITSNQCEHINRLAKEQQDWMEVPVDTAFYIGRDLINAKMVEIARGMMGVGNFELLSEFRKKDDVAKGEDLLRRIGSTPSYDQIVSKYRTERDIGRHAGVNNRNIGSNDVEVDGVIVDVNDIEVLAPNDEDAVDNDNLNMSVELQEIAEEFEEDSTTDLPIEMSSEVADEAAENILQVDTPAEVEEPAVEIEIFVENQPTGAVDMVEIVVANSVPHDDIQYVPTLDAYFSPGRLFPISVQLKKNLCSQCGSCRPNNWCIHLKNAARKAGIPVRDSPLYLRNLTQLRKGQRADKSKSGRKQPRRFDLIQVQDLYNDDESQNIQVELAQSQPLLPRSTVDEVIDSVVADFAMSDTTDIVQSAAAPVETEPSLEPVETEPIEVDQKLWCTCQKESSGDMVACDNLECSVEWFHFDCVGLTRAPRGHWYCNQCRAFAPVASKRKLNFNDENPKNTKKQKTKCPDCASMLAKTYLKTHLKKFCLGIK